MIRVDMEKLKKIIVVIFLLFFSACSVKVGVKVPEEKVIKPIPVSDNPYIQLLRALESFEVDANILLNPGMFTIPELPAIKRVSIEAPENINLHVYLNLTLEKTYSEAQDGSKHLISIRPDVVRADITPNKPIPVRGRGIGFDLKELSYEKQTLTTQMRVKLDLVSFFISPAVGIPVAQINQDVIIKLIKEIHINSLKGEFTPGEALNIKAMAMHIQKDSSVVLKDTIYRNAESVSGFVSIKLALEDIHWIGTGVSLWGDNRSVLEVSKVSFSYEKGSLTVQGDNDPLKLFFAGSFTSEVGELNMNPSSELILKSFTAEYGRDSEPVVRATAGTRWEVSEGWINIAKGKLMLQSSELEVLEADIMRDGSATFLRVKGMNMDAQLSYRAEDPEEILQIINEELGKYIKPPVLSLKATHIYLPGQNYRIEDLHFEIKNWERVNQAYGKFFLKITPGSLMDFEVVLRLSLDTLIDATVGVDELKVPLNFEYDGTIERFTGTGGFDVAGSLKTNTPALVYRDILGNYITKVPKQLGGVKKTNFNVFILPSTLTLRAKARIAQKEDEYYLELSQLDFSGNLHTEFNAGKVALIHLEVPFGSDAVYGISASMKLPTGKSLKFRDEVKIEGEVLTTPFSALETITLPLGRLL